MPFHPAGRPFHRFHRHPQRLNTLHSPLTEWTFRFCSGAKALASRLCRRCSSTWWAEFPQTHRRSKAVRQLTSLYKCRVIVTNKNYGTKMICCAAFMLLFLVITSRICVRQGVYIVVADEVVAFESPRPCETVSFKRLHYHLTCFWNFAEYSVVSISFKEPYERGY